MSKRKKILITYGLVIIIILLAIMFIVPDSFFLKFYDKNVEKITKSENKKIEFVDYDIMKERLLNNQFKYEYLLLDSLSDTSYQYKCVGTIDKDLESGSCTEPERISYTENTKKELFKINLSYVDVNYLLNIIKDSEPDITKYQSSREYKYLTKIENLKTEITIYTGTENITKIEISNKYMTYIIKFSDVSY